MHENYIGHQDYYGIDNITTLNKHRCEKHMHDSKKRLVIMSIRPEVFFKYGLFYPIVFKDAQANQPASYGDRCMQVLGLRSFVSKGFPILFFYVRCQCFSCGSVGVQKNTILNYIKIVKWIPINLLAEYKNKTLVDKCQLFYLHRKT
jgi:hypothetical protein